MIEIIKISSPPVFTNIPPNGIKLSDKNRTPENEGVYSWQEWRIKQFEKASISTNETWKC